MKLALGTVQFGLVYGIANRSGQVGPDEAKSILARARARGIDTLDTAVDYGDSERRLGDIGVEDWRVISKLPRVPDACADVEAWIQDQVLASLARLRIGRLRGLLLHRPGQLLEQNGLRIHRALLALKRTGLVEQIGVSIYDPSELGPLVPRYELDLVQAPFNVLDRRLLRSGWMDRLAKMNIELHTRSAFLQGLLLMPAARRPEAFGRWQTVWKKWDRWLAGAGLSAVQACLRDALAQEGIARVIVGVDSLAQLEEILLAADGPAPELPADLASDDLELIDPSRWRKQ